MQSKKTRNAHAREGEQIACVILIQLLPHLGHAIKDVPLGCVNRKQQRLPGTLLSKLHKELRSAFLHRDVSGEECRACGAAVTDMSVSLVALADTLTFIQGTAADTAACASLNCSTDCCRCRMTA